MTITSSANDATVDEGPATREHAGADSATRRVALVTGASRGIGRATAAALAAAGHRVVVNYVADADAAHSCVDEITQAGGTAVALRGDVSRRTDVDTLVGEVEHRWGPVQVLVNNAGVLRDGLLATMTDDAWQTVLRTNLDGAFYCTRRVLRGMMRSRWGRVVNVASVVGVLGGSGQANYAAAKAGLLGLTKSAARELAGRQITVNAVLPGPIDTELIGHLPSERLAELRGMVPLNRMGSPTDVADVVAFLCSDAAAFITGVSLPVDGGMCML